MGGIGNQLFIYNFGKLVSSKTGLKLILDNSTGFVKDKYGRKPKLDLLFNIKLIEASYTLKVLFILIKKLPKKLLKFLNVELIFESDSKKIIELNWLYNNKSKFFFIQGYFQSHNYVLPNKKHFLELINLNYNFNKNYIDYYNSIVNTTSVCLHVRRDAYDNHLTNSYYINAIQLISKVTTNPTFYVFSDSLNWCRENLFAKNIIFVDVNNNIDDVQEFFLMSNCKYFIVANSSFSWWSAFLGSNTNKIVIAPINNHIGVQDSFYPDTWIKI